MRTAAGLVGLKFLRAGLHSFCSTSYFLPMPTVTKHTIAKDLGIRVLRRVKELRTELGLNQAVFADKAGLGYKYYQMLEAGRKPDFRISTLVKLAEACGVQPWELLKAEPNPKFIEVRIRTPRRFISPAGQRH